MTTPVPGGMRDLASQAQRAAYAEPVNAPVPATSLVIPVRDDNPEIMVARTVNLTTANPFLPILPQDMQRRRAVVIPISQAIWITESRGVASQAAGSTASTMFGNAAWIPVGTQFALEARSKLYAAASDTTKTCTIAVIAERYADPLP